MTLVHDAMPSDLERIEDELLRSVRHESPAVGDVAAYLALAGGKRLRPALSIAASRVCGVGDDAPVPDRVITAGVAIELLHMGSLYHDDVLDEASTRRGAPSVNVRWGNLAAVLGGDLLLARAASAAVSLGLEEARLLADTLDALVTGQSLELQTVGDHTRSEANYFESIDGKTAAAMQAACRLGAIQTDAADEIVDAVTDFGQYIGMAFQIVDDLLDLASTQEKLGKPVGNDIREGVYTLPVIYALEADPSIASLLRRDLDDAGVRAACEAVKASPGLPRAIEAARSHIAAARERLADIDAIGTDASTRPLDHIADMVAAPLDELFGTAP